VEQLVARIQGDGEVTHTVELVPPVIDDRGSIGAPPAHP